MIELVEAANGEVPTAKQSAACGAATQHHILTPTTQDPHR